MTQGSAAPSGALHLQVVREPVDLRTPFDHPARELSIGEVRHHGLPRTDLPELVNRWRRANQGNLFRGLRRIVPARALHLPHFYGQLYLTLRSAELGDLDLGLASLRVVTTAGVNFIVDAFQNTQEVENMKYHGFGTGTTAENVADTALVTELTTQYNPNSTRPTGSQGEGATANVYRTTATLTPDSGFPIAVTEHGVFSATSAGTLLDRSVFGAVTLNSGDSIVAQYDLTVAAGS